MRPRVLICLVFLLFSTPIFVFPSSTVGQTTPPIGREAALSLEFRALDFKPPEVEQRKLASGISVLLTMDRDVSLLLDQSPVEAMVRRPPDTVVVPALLI